jgi:hypothetical protein
VFAAHWLRAPIAHVRPSNKDSPALLCCLGELGTPQPKFEPNKWACRGSAFRHAWNLPPEIGRPILSQPAKTTEKTKCFMCLRALSRFFILAAPSNFAEEFLYLPTCIFPFVDWYAITGTTSSALTSPYSI